MSLIKFVRFSKEVQLNVESKGYGYSAANFLLSGHSNLVSVKPGLTVIFAA